MPFLNEIADRLVAASVGTINIDIFVGQAALIPAGDGPYIVIAETGGSGSLRAQRSALERPSAQISARAKFAPAARAKLKLAYAALGGDDGLYNITLSGTFYLSLVARQHIGDAGYDDAGRPKSVFNIDAVKHSS